MDTANPSPKAACDVFDALRTRRAVRAFLPDPVERQVIEAILELAARAPSGSNIQPWKVWVAAGQARQALCDKLLAAHANDEPDHVEEYSYYPKVWNDPYLARRRKLGLGLYGLLGIAKGDTEKAKAQNGRNYLFFGAPVGLFITIDRQFEMGSWLDTGAFLQSILLAARGFGLHSCPQQSFSKFHKIIKAELSIPDSEIIACGVAIGHEDTAAVENTLVTERAPLSEFATFAWD